jgi:hypothetical protein
MVQKNPLDPDCPWESDDGSEVLSADAVSAEMASIGAELSVLQISTMISEFLNLNHLIKSNKLKFKK